MMFRSVTLSNILNNNGYNQETIRKAPIYVNIVVGVIEFLLSSIYYSYASVFLEETFKEKSYDIFTNIWTIIIFASCYNISGAFTKCMCEYYEHTSHHRYYLVILTIIIHIFLDLCSFISNKYFQMFAYGGIGGLFTSYISAYIQYTLEEEYDIDINTYVGILQVSRSISLSCTPIFVTFIINKYGLHWALRILSALLCIIIPLILLLRRNKLSNTKNELNQGEIENRSCTNITTELSVLNSPTKENNERKLSVSSSSSEELENDVFWNEESEPSNEYNDMNMNPVQIYYSKLFGVNILPSINEESEVDSVDLNEISLKRLSQITSKLEEINKTDIKSVPSGTNVNFLDERTTETSTDQLQDQNHLQYQSQEQLQNQVNHVFFPEAKKRSCCSPYKTYLWKRRWRKFLEFISYNFLIPLFRSIVNIKFYASLLSKTYNLLISTCFITLIPYLAAINTSHTKISMYEESTFILGYSGFTWCFFLLALPVLTSMSNFQLKILHIFGNIMLILCFKVLSKSVTGHIIISCLLFGLGHGIINYTENIVYRDFLGTRQWRDSKGCLSTFSAIFVIVNYSLINYFKSPFSNLINYVIYFYIGNIVLWMVAPIMLTVTKSMKKFLTYKREEDLFT